MKAEFSQSFSLYDLMLLEDLDIQGFATNNPLLPAGEYFGLLYRFTYLAPKATGALAKIIAHRCDRTAVQSLTEIKLILKSIGCSKYLSAFNEIITAIQNDQISAAAISAEKILDDFNGFYTQIVSAKKEEKTELVVNTHIEGGQGVSYPAEYLFQPLKKMLEGMDHEEDTRKLRILAVDDSPVMLKIISSVLENEYKVYTITNPLLVENFMLQITPELFLLDYKMPRLNGFELIPIIRHFEQHKRTPIIFLTSLGTVDHISKALSLGACDFIVKPFQPDILREKVAKHIVRKKSC